MRKRIFSRLMAMFMAVALLSTSALAFDVNQEYIESLTVKSDEYSNSWVELSEKSEGDTNFVLAETIYTEHTLKFSGSDTNATLDLKGNTIDHQNKAGSVIAVTDGAKLTLEDSSEKDEDGNTKGTITGGQGTNHDNNGNSAGGGVYVDDATFVMNGGNIEGNYANWSGGGIFADNGADVTMTGGRISKNRGGGCGSAIMVNGNSSVDLQGGAIAGNFYSYGSTGGGRDEIYNGTGIYNGGGTIKVDSDIAICGVKGWTSSLGSAARHIYLPATCTQPSRCKGCGEVVEGSSPLGHTWSDATCTEPEICTTCGATNGEALGHTYVPATCTEPATCHCGATRGEALGHDMGEWEVTTPAQPGEAGEETRTCSRCDYTETQPIPALPMPIDFGDSFPGGADAGTAISDEETPLAGILTLADLLNALYEHEEIEDSVLPEDFQWADHVYAQAISWALANAVEVDDEGFDPDEVVTVGLLREVLVNYVEYRGIDFTVTVDGADDELVLDLGDRLTAFYARLEEAPAKKAA